MGMGGEMEGAATFGGKMGGGEFWRVEATPGVIPELLRLTVSLWSLPCARLEPGGVFMEVKVFLCLPRTV